jgi:UDP-glucuronate 4-epimerase
MAILVTGGAGFIGSHLLERLLSEGREVVCLDDFNDYYSPALKRRNIESVRRCGEFHLYEGDIRDKALCARIFKENRVETVVHLAARVGVRASLQEPALYQDVNVAGTANLLELSRTHGVKKFIFGSSSSVYGNNSKVPFSEDDRADEPISPYAASKRAGELLCHTYHYLYKMAIVCLRFFTVYGPRQRPDMAIHKFTRLIAAGAEVPMFGDGTMKRDYTFYADIIQGVMAAIEKDFGFEIFNLGESKTVELSYLISLIEKGLGMKARIKRMPKQPGDAETTCADVSKSRRLLGYKPSVPIELGIPIFVDWFRQTSKSGQDADLA